MNIITVDNYEEMSVKAADFIEKHILMRSDSVIGFATGSTPLGLYKRLVARFKEGRLSFKDVTAVNLDEYVGLDPKNRQSYACFMAENLFKHVDIDRRNTHIPNGCAQSLVDECKRYQDLLASLQVDVQILGVGSNGHIGFNEPYTPFDSKAHVVKLSDSTITDNSRLFERVEDVPRYALTMGIGEIMRAKAILLLASGKNKAEAVLNAVKGKINQKWPVSILKTHKNFVLIIDKEAACLL